MRRSGAVVRIGLVAALIVAIGLSVPFFRPYDPRDRDALGALLGAEALSVIALGLLLAFRVGNRRLAAAGVTFMAALIPTCEGCAIAHYPGGSPGPAPPSSIPLIAANLVVMVLAALHFKDMDRRILLIATGVVLLLIFAVDLVYR